MNNIDEFSINFKEVIKNNFYDPPEDELNEYSDFEMGLKRFCFEHNYSIIIKIGDIKTLLYLYHDILDALEEGMCLSLIKLSKGEKVNIEFNDFLLKMTPDLNLKIINCNFTILGTGEYHDRTICLPDMLTKISHLIDGILNIAVEKYYINTEDIYKYLGWKLNSTAIEIRDRL